MYFDTHVHFEALDGDHGAEALVGRAAAAGVRRLLAVGGNPAMNDAARAAARRFPGAVRAAFGCDRDQAGRGLGASALCAALRPALPAASALGEIGLDFHYHPETATPQSDLLRAQLALAREVGLPVIVHSREADAATLDALREHAAAWAGDPGRLGVLHCFTGSDAFARRLLDLGLMISFSGIVTFRNAGPLRAVAAAVPEDRLLIETDTPYLAPVPKRGRRNEPAFLPHVAEALAAARSCRVERVAEMTTANACRLFGEGRGSRVEGQSAPRDSG